MKCRANEKGGHALSLPRAYGSSSRAIFLMHLLHRLPSKFGYLRIKELSNIHPDCGC